MQNPQQSLLVIEDSNEDFEAIQRYVRQAPMTIPIYRCRDGDEALAFLYRTGDYTELQGDLYPRLVLLDLNLPGMDGREVLQIIKHDEHLKLLPVVIFTTSNNPTDIEACYKHGVNSYIIKPINFPLLKRNIQILIDYWFEATVLPADVSPKAES